MNLAWFHKQSTKKNSSETTEERLSRLEAGFRSLLLEWEDSYERLHRLMARVNKRYRDNAAREDAAAAAAVAEDAPGPTSSTEQALDPISARILARRARVVPTRDNGGG